MTAAWPRGGRLRLVGALVELVPLEPEHVPALMDIARADPHAYRFTSTPVTDEQSGAYFDKAFRERDAGRALPFAVLARGSGEVVGTTRFADYLPSYRNCELGYTWFWAELFGEGLNVDSKYLMLRYAFEQADLVRVQIHTDTRNAASQRAIRALGARFEGVLRRHMIVKGGFVRDTMVFAITDLDWPGVRAHLEGRLRKRGVAPEYEAFVSEPRAESPPGRLHR